jgi:hypothetical protein
MWRRIRLLTSHEQTPITSMDGAYQRLVRGINPKYLSPDCIEWQFIHLYIFMNDCCTHSITKATANGAIKTHLNLPQESFEHGRSPSYVHFWSVRKDFGRVSDSMSTSGQWSSIYVLRLPTPLLIHSGEMKRRLLDNEVIEVVNAADAVTTMSDEDCVIDYLLKTNRSILLISSHKPSSGYSCNADKTQLTLTRLVIQMVSWVEFCRVGTH